MRITAILLHAEKSNQSAMRFYERNGYSVFRNAEHRLLLKKEGQWMHPTR